MRSLSVFLFRSQFDACEKSSQQMSILTKYVVGSYNINICVVWWDSSKQYTSISSYIL